MNRSTEEKGYFYWPWHQLDPGVWEAGVAYLADVIDTHAQGVRGALSPIQDQVLSLCLTPERAVGGRVIVLWKPFIVTSLVLNIIVGWTLLGSEVFRIQRAAPRQRKRVTGTSQGELGQCKAEQVSLSPMRADPTCFSPKVTSWRRKWQPSPVFLSRESHGRRSLVGYSPGVSKSRTRLSDLSNCCTESDTTEVTSQQFSLLGEKPSFELSTRRVSAISTLATGWRTQSA